MAGVLFSTIYLGQHYIIDLIGGIAVAAGCVFLMTKVVRAQTLKTSLEIQARSGVSPILSRKIGS